MQHDEAWTASSDPPDDHTWHLAILASAAVDPVAFAPLYDRYAEDVYYFCYRRLRHPEEAADATSQVFVKVLRALPGYRPGSINAGAAFRAWLFRIAHTTVIDIQRRRRPVDSLDADGGDAARAPVPASDRAPEEEAIRNEEARLVQRLFFALPERQRLVIELRLAGLSGQEIADSLGISLSATKAAQFRAYRTLRRLLHQLQTDTAEEVHQ